MEKYKGILTTVGFLMFIIGFVSLMLIMIGLKLSYLTWIDAPGPLFGLIVRLFLIFGGVLLVVLVRTDFKGENEYIN